MKWLLYLLEANLYLCICYGFYRLVLQRETFYTVNRWYLILSILIAFSLPFFHIKEKGTLSNLTITNKIENRLDIKNALPSSISNQPVVTSNQPVGNNLLLDWRLAILIVYLSIVIVGLLRTWAGIFKIIQLFLNSPKYKNDHVTHVFIEAEQKAFSFFNWLFYDKNIDASQVVIGHEMVHIRQRHTVDVLLIELIQTLNWFNPFIRYMKADIRLNHEFIADKQVAGNVINKYDYALLLINHAYIETSPLLANAMFNPEHIKRRINQLGGKKSDFKASFKYLLMLPLFITLLGISGFAIKKDYGYVNIGIGNDLPRVLNKPFQSITSNSGSTAISKKTGIPYAIDTDTIKKHKRNFKLSKERLTNKNSRILTNSKRPFQQDTITKKYDRVSPVYHNGQVSIATFKGKDTSKRYSIRPVFQNGQVSIVKAEIDTAHSNKRN